MEDILHVARLQGQDVCQQALTPNMEETCAVLTLTLWGRNTLIRDFLSEGARVRVEVSQIGSIFPRFFQPCPLEQSKPSHFPL